MELKFEDFMEMSYHKKSKEIEENQSKLEDYEIKEYEFSGKPFRLKENGKKIYTLNSEKFDFNFSNDYNLGWKIHLNISHTDIRKVMIFLIQSGYLHKLFSGGELEDGKVFTIYFGNWDTMIRESKVIQKKIGDSLKRPKDFSEIEIERGIVGRFNISKKNFCPYWILWNEFSFS